MDGIRNALHEVEDQSVAKSAGLEEESKGAEADFDGFESDMDVDSD